MRRLEHGLALAALAAALMTAFTASAQSPGNFSTLGTTGAATLNGDVLACSGRPWLDVRCPSFAGGAVGDDSHDDTAALQAAIAAAVAGNYPLRSATGFRLVSEGATIDGRGIANGPVLQVECSGGTGASPANCFYFKEQGGLFVDADTSGYAVVVGKADFSDAQNSLRIDHLVVNNASAAATAGGCQFNYVLDSDIYAVCDAAGGGAGVALEQTQFSRLSGAGSAAATGGVSLLLENGYDNSNVIFGFDMEVSPTCLSITFPHDGMNTFVSPYFSCTTAVNATASDHNLLINPTYSSAVVNDGPQSTGIEIVGGGNRDRWNFPAVATYTATGIDDGTALSSFNAPGTSMSVTLPAPATVGAGWSMGFATDNGKGMTLATPSGAIIAGGKTLTTLVLGAGNHEYVRLESDGSNFRIISSTRNTRTANGLVSRDWPGNWLYPATPGYAATLADNGNVLSSFDTAAGLTVTLPPTTGLPSGWSIGLATDNGKSLALQVNATAGGRILYPQAGSGVAALGLAGNGFEYMTLQYDGGGNFRVEQVTPATAQQLGFAGTAGFSRWSYPSASAYAATLADNGNVISNFNSSAGFMAVTLPPTTAISAGWTIGLATDNGKTLSVQVNGSAGGKILLPGAATAATSLALAPDNSEFVELIFDGSNFRPLAMTPATAGLLQIAGAALPPRWSFPATAAYGAAAADNGNVVSSFNAPGSGMTVTLPSTTGLAPGWTLGVATDNGKAMTVQVNGTAGGQILVPGTKGASGSVTLATNFTGYELLSLQFDGTNFRVVGATPATASLNGMSMPVGTPASSGAACQTGALETDGAYLYLCAAPNTWKRAALSSF